jgi:signal-transduction protein with cAMP-binding, CBS, and nucleotidyltransferase domain
MPVVGDLLTGQALVTLPASATAFAAACTMTDAKIGAILVTDTDGTLAGIFTERDLMSRVVVRGLDPRRVVLVDVMTRDVYSVARDHKVADVRVEMQTRHIRHLPVVDGRRVCGMLSLRDILRADLELVVNEMHALEGYFLGDSTHPHR